jgi:DNA polymerase I-like protein with 3'-5' exonuclease and polymerase domains
MVESGRTACAKSRAEGGKKAFSPTNGFQQQNPKRSFMWMPPGEKKAVPLFPPGVGIRECFEAREGMLYADDDYSGLELHTGAQVCLNTVGYSQLAVALNAQIDPHLDFGASMMGISHEEALSRKHEKSVKSFRQLAKIGNFGLPGGLGLRGVIGFARGYGVKLTESEGKTLIANWFTKYPEWKDYFRWIRDRLDRVTQLGDFEQLYVNRWRGRCRYTEACNTLFQGLGADVAKNGLYEVAKHCYVQMPNSVLYGARPVGFIHDEILAEVHEELAHEQAFEIADIMVREGNKLLPDVPVRCVPALSKRWCKDAEAVFDKAGRLQPYDLAREGRWDVYYDTNASVKVKWV